MPSHHVPARAVAKAALLLFLVVPPLAAQQSRSGSADFRHSTHRRVDCAACHEAGQQQPTMNSRTCLSCHHRAAATSNCRACHAGDDPRSIDGAVTRTLDIRVGSLDRPERTLPMSHAVHAGVRCQTCHASGPALSAAEEDCANCHEQHHRPSTTCADCHDAPAPGVHTVSAHLGCTGSACHENAPASIATVPRTRTFCLVCHRGMERHRPDEPCASCHVLPPPGTAGH